MTNWPAHGDYSANPVFRAAQIMTNVAQILDVVKIEWAAEGQWSEWDQGVRDSISAWLRDEYDGQFMAHRALAGSSAPTPDAGSAQSMDPTPSTLPEGREG